MINSVFIAISIPSSLQNTIIKQTSRFRESIDGKLVRWVPAENIHLTLKYIGNIPDSHLDFLKQSLTQTASTSQSFDLQITGLGSFPNSKQPRVLWVGIHAPVVFNILQQNIEDSMARLGYQKEDQPYSPHLTLGRVRQSASQNDRLKIRDAIQTIQTGNIGTARVNSIHLYKSDPTPSGSEYTNLFSATFKQ